MLPFSNYFGIHIPTIDVPNLYWQCNPLDLFVPFLDFIIFARNIGIIDMIVYKRTLSTQRSRMYGYFSLYNSTTYPSLWDSAFINMETKVETSPTIK